MTANFKNEDYLTTGRLLTEGSGTDQMTIFQIKPESVDIILVSRITTPDVSYDDTDTEILEPILVWRHFPILGGPPWLLCY